MTIKEIEQELGIKRASIRFYEKENLIRPQREENGYREYSEQDLAVLKKIVIFRKIGIPVADIEEILDGAKPLSEAIDQNIENLEKQLEELNGALQLSRILQKRGEELSTFDEKLYWEEMCREEKNGSRFLDLARDVVGYEKHVFLSYFGMEDCEGGITEKPAKAVLRVIGTCCLLAGVFCLMKQKWDVRTIAEGFLYPFEVIACWTILGLPFLFLGKKHPEAAEKLKKISLGICGGLTLVILVLAFFLRS